jgi:CHAT domain-containing protein
MGTFMGLLVAGTHSMLVSQWKFNSVSSSQLMVDFYQALDLKEKAKGGEKPRWL